MDIDEVHNSLLQDVGIPSVKATAVEQYVLSPITFWCDVHAPEDASDLIDPYTQHLFQVGHEYQSEVTTEQYPDAIQEIFVDEEEGFLRTLELMAQGERHIKNMPLICRPIGLEGRPDLLVRTEDLDSRFGSYAYRVVEIKSAM